MNVFTVTIGQFNVSLLNSYTVFNYTFPTLVLG